MKKFNLKKKKLYLHEIIVTKEGGIIFLTSMTAKVQKQIPTKVLLHLEKSWKRSLIRKEDQLGGYKLSRVLGEGSLQGSARYFLSHLGR